MRRFLTVSVCAALAIGVAGAQAVPVRPPGGGGTQEFGMGPGGGGRWLDQLKLSAAQKTKMGAIRKKQAAEMKAIFDSKLSGERKRARLKAISDSTDKQIRSILTPAQQKKWDEMRKNRRAMMGPGMGPRGGGMTADLGLTPAQKSKVDGIMKRTGDQMRAIRESKATEEQKRAKMKALWDASNKQVRSILTPAQQKKWDARMRPRIAN